MKIDKGIVVEGLLCYWCRRLLAKETIFISTDNRYNAHMIVEEISENNYKIAYNQRKIKEWNYGLIISGVFHEIGHIKYGWLTESINNGSLEAIMDEYFAEEYAIRMMRKYYPNLIDAMVKYTKEKMCTPDWVAQFPVHFQAYQHIKEYEL